jgi:ferrous iron transport protein A
MPLILADKGNEMNIIKRGRSIMSSLKEIKCGQTVTVKKVEGLGPVRRRIMDMGITRGCEVFVRKVAPLGDPIEVTVRGYELSLRKADAEMIVVE